MTQNHCVIFRFFVIFYLYYASCVVQPEGIPLFPAGQDAEDAFTNVPLLGTPDTQL